MARHLLKKLPALKAIYYQPCNISYSVFPLSPPARYWRNLSCEAGADGASWLLGLPLKVSFQWPLEQIEKMCVMAWQGSMQKEGWIAYEQWEVSLWSSVFANPMNAPFRFAERGALKLDIVRIQPPLPCYYLTNLASNTCVVLSSPCCLLWGIVGMYW